MIRLSMGLRAIGAAMILGGLTLASAPLAHAAASYDALAQLTLTLTGVTATDQAPVTDGWTVIAVGSEWDSGATSFGTANAEFVLDLAPTTTLNVGERISHSSKAFGDATDGSADSLAETDFNVELQNDSRQSLVFNFDYAAMVDAIVGGQLSNGEDAHAYAAVELDRGPSGIDRLLDVYADLAFNPLSDADRFSGSFSVTLLQGDSVMLAWMVDAYGSADAELASEDFAPAAGTVSEPASIVLLSLGLAGIGFARRQAIETA